RSHDDERKHGTTEVVGAERPVHGRRLERLPRGEGNAHLLRWHEERPDDGQQDEQHHHHEADHPHAAAAVCLPEGQERSPPPRPPDPSWALRRYEVGGLADEDRWFARW